MKQKKRKNRFIVKVVFTFFALIIPYILIRHFFAVKEMPPQSWKEILNMLRWLIPLMLVSSIIFNLLDSKDNDK